MGHFDVALVQIGPPLVEFLMALQSTHQPGARPEQDALYKELWYACAGPLVNVPREGERVYYFPQGHMEQLEASTHQGFDKQMPSFDLPSKILCKVANIELRAENETDEVYAQITLVPESDQSEVTKPDPPVPDPPRCNVHSFCKTLTASDTSTHGGFSVLRYVSAATLSGTYGNRSPWKWLDFPSHFSRTSRSDFLVSVNKYLEAKNHKLSVGMRFKMRFEGDEVPERRFSGTIVGVDVSSSSTWVNSDWRSLKVQWDEPSSIVRPERVSPWELEPLVATNTSNSQSQPTQRHKRPRTAVMPSSATDLSTLGMWKSPGDPHTACAEFERTRDQFLSVTKPGSSCLTAKSPLPGIPNQLMYWSNRADKVSESLGSVVNKESGEKRKSSLAGCRLFGIQLFDHSNLDQTSTRNGEDQPIPSLEAESDRSNANQSDVPSLSCDPDKTLSQSKQNRTCTKVHMQGVAVGRAVDLTRFDCYEDLLKKLEQLFDIKGELCCSSGKWQVVYTDNEDDMMMVGDDPWQEFCSMVRKIFIYTSEEVKRLSPKSKISAEVDAKPGSADVELAAASEEQSSAVGP
ncbi:Auxin response factor 1 [Bienertia sinuspersici]